MQKNRSVTTVLAVLVLVVLNILFFLWTSKESRGVIEWSSYGAMMFAYCVACFGIFHIHNDNRNIYQQTTAYLSIAYLVVQTIASATAIYGNFSIRRTERALQSASDNLPDAISELWDGSGEILSGLQTSFIVEYYQIIVLSAFVIIFAIYAGRIGIHYMANRATDLSLQEQEMTHLIIKDWTSAIKSMIFAVSDNDARKALSSLNESVRFCSSAKAEQVKDEIDEGLKVLSTKIASQEWNEVAVIARRLKSLLHV